ncbi:MAG: O-methyltransferase [Muribaculaceae bacterium]|nr:O-methyltransferase [Muribaculaceae bacterium]
MLDEYIARHTAAEPQQLADIYRDTWLHSLYPQMCVGHVEGRLLKMLTAMIRPRRVLELGTFSGYSALCIAEGLEDDATIDTVEINDEAEDTLRRRFAASPYGSRIRLHIGDALAVIPALAELEWDMVYIDANKRYYIDYLDLILPRLKTGGFILADNTLWGGKVADPAATDGQTEGIRCFNDYVAANPALEVVILPLRDGLSLIRKTKD